MIFECHEVLGSDRDMGRRHGSDRALGHMDCHGNTVVLRQFNVGVKLVESPVAMRWLEPRPSHSCVP